MSLTIRPFVALCIVLITSPHAAVASCTWVTEKSGNTNPRNYLRSVAASSDIDAWAVGTQVMHSGGNPTLIEHWDGARWRVWASPNVDEYNYLEGVAAVSSTEVWAVGYHYGSHGPQTLIELWDGSQWNVVPSPNGTSINFLYGAAADSTGDVWAVGAHSSSPARTLTEEWDGTAWAILPSPNIAYRDNRLIGVTSLSPNDAWAVGYHQTGPGALATLIEHWNGSAWSVVESPNIINENNLLASVIAVTRGNVWAVGYHYSNSNQSLYPLTVHWDGTRWKIVTTPGAGELVSAASTPFGDVWAVGSSGSNNTLTEHWNGTTWTIVPSPNGGQYPYNTLNGVAYTENHALAVGDNYSLGDYYFSQTLAMSFHC